MKRISLLLAAVVLAGCANDPYSADRMQQSLQILTQANNDAMARNAMLNQRPLAAPAPYQAQPMMWTLTGQSMSGSMRYCRYANGTVNTYDANSYCPPSIRQ